MQLQGIRLKKNPYPLGSDHPTITPFGSFKTSDDEIIIAIGNEKLFKKFCKILEDEKMAKSEDFNSNEKRNQNIRKLRIRIEKN